MSGRRRNTLDRGEEANRRRAREESVTSAVRPTAAHGQKRETHQLIMRSEGSIRDVVFPLLEVEARVGDGEMWGRAGVGGWGGGRWASGGD